MTHTPPGWNSVIPRIITPDVKGLGEFIIAVFDAEGEIQKSRPTELKIGDSILMLSDGENLREDFPAFLYVYMTDVDATYERAMSNAAISIEEPLDTPYGDRRATVQDSWGNIWQMAKYGG